MYDKWFDVLSAGTAIFFGLILVRLILSRPIGWRDFSVVFLTVASFLFWSLIALRRVFDWALEVALLAFLLKFIGGLLVMIHVWTQDSEDVNRPENLSR